ncbi:MAG: hypothetical protein QGG34_08275 [SAR202 cluster bacterium]|jgi:hypothetical protein|nr:hypothetical protein [SAR202 cluster bacterium]MDP6302591.1 hypothetical protein [SAR202 cluster bacterium]MDP7103998.1 hypothetical protein [SAR202 cluster bacterium]MDP7225555.1 hypothetical protein [SAR202 cluster bacterium]MDP7413612.1 hypothetical protein [SAR202 cluster bacterium]|tara:strand:- start:16737 stop:17309 length:573 start_codon:yes stop_codon:yes gene_type:complete
MEGFALILIGAAIFSHSWYLLGMYSDARPVGVIMAALAAGILITLTMQPQVVGYMGSNGVQLVGEMTMMKMLIVMWAVYAGIVAAQGWWDLEERSIGLYAVPLAISSAMAIFFFATQLWEHDDIAGVSAGGVTATMTGATAILTVLAAVMFAYMAKPVSALKPVAGWFMLVGSIGVMVIGLAIISTVIAY